MQVNDAIESFHSLGEEIRSFFDGKAFQQEEWEKTLQVSEHENPWFTRDNTIRMLRSISGWLDRDGLNKWLNPYTDLDLENNKQLTVGVVMAGNLPLVGFHDFLCVLLSGNKIKAKLSSSDSRLFPFLVNKLIDIEPEWKGKIEFVEKLSTVVDAIIATGNNNTARHFEYYFRNIPHIIRKNRNSIAILNGLETNSELHALGEDIFSYFGLGCRNISKLYVPLNYDFSNFFKAIEPYKAIINHNKYHSNYVYNRTIYLMDGKKFTDNGFLLVINSTHTSSPIAVLNFEEYENIQILEKKLIEMKNQIQCIAATDSVKQKLSAIEIPVVKMGEAQSPSLSDYADGIDVIRFLLEQNQ
jgi:hypothetical protein